MPVMQKADYLPEFMLRNGHINTIFPYYFRNISSPWQHRERIETPDQDFYDVDWILNGKRKKLIVLLHGLEGSSQSQYMKGFGHYFSVMGFHVAAPHFRSCSGELNNTLTLYHSGFTEDLHHFLSQKSEKYEEVFLCGFSLGGSVCLNYLGRNANVLPGNITAAAAISVPVDLFSSSKRLKKWYNLPYSKRFLLSLRQKIQDKHTQFPGFIDIAPLATLKDLWEFDEHFTAPLHGFSSAEDYYITCSSKPHLYRISRPALIVNSQDDSFLTPECMPVEEATNNPAIHLLLPRYGGHAGFASLTNKTYWIEQTVYRFFLQQSSEAQYANGT